MSRRRPTVYYVSTAAFIVALLAAVIVGVGEEPLAPGGVLPLLCLAGAAGLIGFVTERRISG